MIVPQYMIWIVLLVILLTVLIISIYYYWKKHHANILLPSRFLMDEEYVTGVIKVLRKMMLIRGEEIILDFLNIEKLSYESYMILIAQAEKAYHNGKTIYIKSMPKERKEITDIIQSKNKNHKTYHKYIKLEKNSNTIFKQSTIISPNLTLSIETELKRIGIKDYYDFNTLLTEILGNAVEHGIRNRNINWWMYHYKNRDTKTLSFVFVDMGIGIIDSYKKAGLPPEYEGLIDNEILMNALNGSLGSSTKDPNRGRGLPQLKLMVEKKWISDFVLITNSVSLRYINDNFIIKRHPNFVGTYYSWTINKENYTAWKKR